jgi:sugar phosphate isomerase/epimerase
MILGCQNKHWGNIEEATKFWLELGIDHLMVKNAENIPLINAKGEIRYEDFRKLGRLQDEYGVKYHLHPYRFFVKRRNDEILLDTLSNDARTLYKNIIKEIDNQIQENGLYPLIVFHLTTLDDPELPYKQTEEMGLKQAKEFFQSLDLKSNIALETMHDPYRNPGYWLLGYKANHFLEIIGDRKFGICIDTGHLFMAEEPLRKFLELPYPILSIHYNGCDGKSDSHHLPTKDNIKDAELVEKLLKSVKGPIILEIRNYGYSKEILKKIISETKKGVVLEKLL